VRFDFGHVGRVPGQPEREIEPHDRHLAEGNADEVFGPDAVSLWQRLIKRVEPAEPMLSPDLPPSPGLR
jgi:hypothetical protein